MKRTLWLIMIWCLTIAAVNAVPPGYTLVFNSSWNGRLSADINSNWGPIVSPAQWICHTPSNADFGSAYFTGVLEKNSLGQSINPFSVSGGHLTIKASIDPSINHWRSGLISSIDTNGNGFSQTLGYWEARIYNPTGSGVWPAFWLESTNVIQRASRSTNAGEIDVMEMYGVDMTKLHQQIHVWTPAGVDDSTPGSGDTVTVNDTGWHVYGCLVNFDFVHWYFDGVETFKTPTDPSMLGPMFVMADFAIGGGWPVDLPSPTFMYINYIRCYAPLQSLQRPKTSNSAGSRAFEKDLSEAWIGYK